MKQEYFVSLAGLLATVAAGIPSAMAADTTGWYAGVGIGQAHLANVCADARAGGFVGNCNDKDTSWKIFGGYDFNRNFAVEAGYVDLGEATLGGNVGAVAISANAKAKGWELLGVGTIPVTDQLGIYGKIGAFRWDVDVTATAALPPAFAIASAGATGTDLTYGVGVKFDFTRNIGARLEWQRYDNLGDSATTGRENVNLFSAGVVVKF